MNDLTTIIDDEIKLLYKKHNEAMNMWDVHRVKFYIRCKSVLNVSGKEKLIELLEQQAKTEIDHYNDYTFYSTKSKRDFSRELLTLIHPQ